MTAEAQITLRDEGVACARLAHRGLCPHLYASKNVALLTWPLYTRTSSNSTSTAPSISNFFTTLKSFRGVSGSMSPAVLNVDVSDMSSTAPVGLANKTIL